MNTEHELFGELHEQEENGLFGNEHRRQYEAQQIVDAWNSQLNQSRVMPRYFVDIRGGCGAVRDRWHESYDEDYPGLHSDTLDVVEYKHGYIANGVWNMKDEDIKYLNDLCERLNNEV